MFNAKLGVYLRCNAGCIIFLRNKIVYATISKTSISSVKEK